jgi:hypothetical protein
MVAPDLRDKMYIFNDTAGGTCTTSHYAANHVQENVKLGLEF